MLELLSPAGSPESVVAAVQSGADAIYLGLDGGFNARRGAKNFSREEYLNAVRYCRERDCKVYVTLNTLVSDRELKTLAEIGRFLSDTGADAVLVQDLGAAKVLRVVCPDLPLHASTQMSVHNLAGVHAAAQLGIRRVVLARELGRDQIKFIAAHSPIELEVFVHGALCFCHSGQCYLSALIGRRSGNRGMCAQPCRMQYSMGRRLDDYPMSLKDNCLIDYLAELDEMGVKCVKLEGRMKRPEYTAIVTEIYHKAIHEGAGPSERDMQRLELAFSRDGFTDGYYTGEKRDMHGVRGADADADPDLKALYNEARRAYAAGELRRAPVDFHIELRRGRAASLSAKDDAGRSVTVYGAEPKPAARVALTQEAVTAQLYRTGGTQYRCRKVTGVIDEGLFLPAAAVNALRRAALTDLNALRAAPPRRRTRPSFPSVRAGGSDKNAPERMRLNVQVLSVAQLTPSLAERKPDNLCLPLELFAAPGIKKALVPFTAKEIGLIAVFPRVITEADMEPLRKLVETAKMFGVREALTGNLGHIALARAAGFEVRGDFGLNVFNSQTMQVLKDAGLLSATASFELRLGQVRDLVKCIETEMILYGRLPCMVTDQDILARAGMGTEESAALSDRTGAMFPVSREFGGRNVVWNAHKLFMADKLSDIAACGLSAGRLVFTTESPRECVLVAERYLGRNDYQPNGLTRGLYFRGVE